ncbi:hypothetical protein L798_04941 [Zootermopsis nevadensis]|uniref:Uncharacterized protein n=1 Tax=Zootermopsis nevadensis TaxID=136037 RepID=A0A067R9P1_ZOONE|nr:hypothetical protein L798_04941 [Zootermopsis nevadensis]
MHLYISSSRVLQPITGLDCPNNELSLVPMYGFPFPSLDSESLKILFYTIKPPSGREGGVVLPLFLVPSILVNVTFLLGCASLALYRCPSHLSLPVYYFNYIRLII